MEANKPGTVQVEHFYAQSPTVVWNALTEPSLHARWWAAGDVRPIVGHHFDLDMGEWGKQECEVLQVEAEQLFRYTFAVGDLDTIITWRLELAGSGTRLELTHEGFDVDSPMGRQAFEGMKAGWPHVLARLDTVLGV